MLTSSEEQRLFAEAAGRFLDAHHPVASVRSLAAMDSTFDADLWRRCAELGWTSLLVAEPNGGGSISGNGLVDLLPVAYLFGRHAAPGPLFGSNLVACALDRWGTEKQREGPLAQLMSGEVPASWAQSSTVGADGHVLSSIAATVVGDDVVLNGRAFRVESADAGYLLVTANELTGRSQFLVPGDLAGMTCTRLVGLDLTRRLFDVEFADVRVSSGTRIGEPGAADAHDADLLDVLITLLSAELVGTMIRAFEMVIEWTTSRYSFGRPLASYQEIKHRLADLRMQLEASEAITADAAASVGSGSPRARMLSTAAMAYVGAHATELIQDCVQLHGGIGVTEDHDLHIFLRRATVDASLYGRPREYAARLGGLIVAAEGLSA